MPQSYRVLSVEDDDEQFALLRITLRSMPLELRRASSGKEALELLPEFMPQLLLLDVTLPDIRGWQVLDWLKTNIEILNNIPVIVLTGHTEASHRVIGRLQEVTHYMNKPFEPDELRAKIKSVLNIPD